MVIFTIQFLKNSNYLSAEWHKAKCLERWKREQETEEIKKPCALVCKDNFYFV